MSANLLKLISFELWQVTFREKIVFNKLSRVLAISNMISIIFFVVFEVRSFTSGNEIFV